MKTWPVAAFLCAAVLLASAETGLSYESGPKEPNKGVRKVEKGEGIITKQSNHTVDETVARLEGMLRAKGVKLFIVIDHSGEAAKVGLKMPNTKLLIFGSPKAGTPLMVAAPSIAIDLPLKILVAEDSTAKVWVSYNGPEYLKERHGLPNELVASIAIVEGLVAKATE